MTAPRADRRREHLADTGLCLLPAVGTIAYLAVWPRDLFRFDEGLYLYESKRLLDGDVFYRGIFEIITLGSVYLMAGMYWLFGVSMLTARMSMAVSSRWDRRSDLLGLPPNRHPSRHCDRGRSHALGDLLRGGADGEPPPRRHIFGRRPPPAGTALANAFDRRAAACGILIGALIGVQQQRGLRHVDLGSRSCWLSIIGWLGASRRSPETSLLAELSAYAAGVVVVVVPMFVALIAAAGWGDVFHDLVRVPLVNYHGALRSAGLGVQLEPQLGAAVPPVPGVCAVPVRTGELYLARRARIRRGVAPAHAGGLVA